MDQNDEVNEDERPGGYPWNAWEKLAGPQPIVHTQPDGTLRVEWPYEEPPPTVLISTVLLMNMIAQHNDSVQTFGRFEKRPFELLQAWLAEDRETHVVEIEMRAGDPTYGEGRDEVLSQPFEYIIEASWMWFYGEPTSPEQLDPPAISQTAHGHGGSLNEAAAEVLRVMAEWREFEAT